jgi:hypothetical protein
MSLLSRGVMRACGSRNILGRLGMLSHEGVAQLPAGSRGMALQTRAAVSRDGGATDMAAVKVPASQNASENEK